MPPSQGNAPVTGWTVGSQTETYEPGPTGQITRGVRVYFTLPSGVGGSVFIPEAQYNPVNVRAAIAAKASMIADVSNLTG